MAVLPLVVDRRAALDDALQALRPEHLAGLGGAPDFLGQRQRGAAVAIAHADQHGPRLVVERQHPALGLLRARQELGDALFVK